MRVMKLFWLAAIAALLGSCGGGSDSDPVVNTPVLPPTILSDYNFEIGGIRAGTDMTVDVGGQFQVWIWGIPCAVPSACRSTARATSAFWTSSQMPVRR